MTNTNRETVRLVIKSTNTVYQIKKIVEAIEGISASQQCLIFEGYILKDLKTLGECNINTGSEITNSSLNNYTFTY